LGAYVRGGRRGRSGGDPIQQQLSGGGDDGGEDPGPDEVGEEAGEGEQEGLVHRHEQRHGPVPPLPRRPVLSFLVRLHPSVLDPA
jgi:hypothetical protein